jgi:hypothetical protein
MRKIGSINPAFLILICGSIAGAVTGCSSPLPSLASNNQSTSASGTTYTSGSCEDFGAERHVAGRVFRWCAPEPGSLN